MTQVLASRKGKTIGVFFLLVGVLVVHGFVLRSDIRTYRIGAALQGPGWALFETLLDGLFFGFVLVLSVLCGYQQWKLDKSVDELIREVDGQKKGYWKLILGKISKWRNKKETQPAEASGL